MRTLVALALVLLAAAPLGQVARFRRYDRPRSHRRVQGGGRADAGRPGGPLRPRGRLSRCRAGRGGRRRVSRGGPAQAGLHRRLPWARPRAREGGPARRGAGRVRAGARGGPADRRSPDREGDRSVPEAARPPALVLGYTPPARRDPSDRRHARAAARARVSPAAVTPRDERARGGRLRGGGRVLLDVVSLPGGRSVPPGGGGGVVARGLAAAPGPRPGPRTR